MGPAGVRTPALVGAGQKSSRALEVGLMRFVGMMLPPKGTGAAALPGHAPCAFTDPAHGSMIGVPMLEKSPARSSVVGTVAVKGCPVRKRKPSQLRNQNVRLRPLELGKRKGPPASPPN